MTSASTTTAPISYTSAIVACEAAHLALSTAGPAACKLAPSSYVPMLKHLKATVELLRIIEERRVAREGRAAAT